MFRTNLCISLVVYLLSAAQIHSSEVRSLAVSDSAKLQAAQSIMQELNGRIDPTLDEDAIQARLIHEINSLSGEQLKTCIAGSEALERTEQAALLARAATLEPMLRDTYVAGLLSMINDQREQEVLRHFSRDAQVAILHRLSGILDKENDKAPALRLTLNYAMQALPLIVAISLFKQMHSFNNKVTASNMIKYFARTFSDKKTVSNILTKVPPQFTVETEILLCNFIPELWSAMLQQTKDQMKPAEFLRTSNFISKYVAKHVAKWQCNTLYEVVTNFVITYGAGLTLTIMVAAAATVFAICNPNPSPNLINIASLISSVMTTITAYLLVLKTQILANCNNIVIDKSTPNLSIMAPWCINADIVGIIAAFWAAYAVNSSLRNKYRDERYSSTEMTLLGFFQLCFSLSLWLPVLVMVRISDFDTKFLFIASSTWERYL